MLGLLKAALAATLLASSLVASVPTPNAEGENKVQARAATYWVEDIKRQGTVAFGDGDVKIFRNVKDYGAKGCVGCSTVAGCLLTQNSDGVTDDTEAINNAIADGARCGKGCDSTTVKPAIIYFPNGIYAVSRPIIQLYYTQFIGDANNLPTVKALPSFQGIGVIDSDPYDDQGNNWYTNQNNFFRQIRNFIIDVTSLPPSTGTGMHWQVAQATSLHNIIFNMIKGGADNKQQGIFMDNGSGGFMSNLTFNGGRYGAFFGNQQFTTRDLTFNDCQTAIFMNWNWLWTFKSLRINNCQVGIDMANGGPGSQLVGSVLVQDSTFSNTPIGISTAYVIGSPASNGTLIVDNVDFTGSTKAIADTSGNPILAGGSKVASWGQGHAYSTGTGVSAQLPAGNQIPIQGPLTAPKKPANLLSDGGKIFERNKPQYETVPSSSFVSVKSKGAKGDGVTDDTAAIQSIFDAATPDQIVYFDHGAYLIKDTIRVPTNIKITGEIWPLIMADGPSFSDPANPKPVFQVGQAGEKGAVEMSDLMFETKGPAPGAILMEWNLAGAQPGAAAMWDVHFRVGGSAGTGLQSDKCTKNPKVIADANPECVGAFMLLHITKQASVYLENNWYWVADHELDLPDYNQINIFNGRGVLIESAEGPIWMYGTSAEHNTLYNYQILNAKNVYMGAIQTETPCKLDLSDCRY